MPAVNGSAELRLLAVRLKDVGARDLRLEMLRGLRNAAKPIVPAIREGARAKLPKTGGLNERVAKSEIKTQVRPSARTATVRIVATEHDVRSSNFGGVRHPTFGHRDRWVAQDIPDAKSWFFDAAESKTKDSTDEMLTVMAVIGAKLTARPYSGGTVRLSSSAGRP